MHISLGPVTILAGKKIPLSLSSPQAAALPNSRALPALWCPEQVDVQPAIGTKVSDYILQHKKVDEYTDTDLYTVVKPKASAF